MNIVFMGTPDFAAVALKALVGDAGERFSVKTVVTRPDGASSRGKTLLPSPVRVAAEEQGIPVITPRSFYVASTPSSDRTTGQKRVVDTALLDPLAATDPDFIVVAAFGLL
ncbi:MAG TPA: hypothetical protein DEB24_06800, partial [Coriobacteriia bacterium]|nr:hypothetical protein [Coriobacteriia bacterium]